jgi:aminoglycoside 2'-N-acetyltransferase I
MDALTMVQAKWQTLAQAERAEVIRLCTEAYEEDFADFFQAMPGTTHLLGRLDGQLVSHLAWVTRWLQPAGVRLLETAYIEAVATAPAHQGKGYASMLLREAAARIQAYDLGALSPSDEGFYARLGWVRWRGRLGIRTAEGVEPTPADEEVMVMRLRKTPELDLDALLTAEWRDGELW